MSNKKESDSTTDPFLDRETEKYVTPVPSREFILETLGLIGQESVKRRALIHHFGIDDPLLQEGLRRRLKAMVRDGQLLKTSKGYAIATHMESCEGVIVLEREGEGYLHTQTGQKVQLTGPSLRGYYDGDRVEAQILAMDSEKARGRVIRVLEAVTPYMVGRLMKEEDSFWVIPFDRKNNTLIEIPREHVSQAKPGDIVHVEILREEQYRTRRSPIGKVIDILGDLASAGIEVKIALRQFEIPTIFPDAALKEAEGYGKEVVLSEKGTHRDLRDILFVTIDGEDAKDFDDAVYCAQHGKGYRLWVAIADVSYYVKPGHALDKEALNRGNSTYFPGTVIPMLPEALSNGLCSLKPKVDRLTVVCEMEINNKGKITQYSFYRAIIQSRARLTYTEVAEMVNGNEALRQEYTLVLSSLEMLHALYHVLHTARRTRGAIDFDTVETRILFNQQGKIGTIIPQVRNVAHKMIEESMLAANVCAAEFIKKHKRPALYRIHDAPPGEKLTALRHFLAELGLQLSGRTKPCAKDFSKLMDTIREREDRHMIQTVMLRSLSQAQYSPKNIGHFGLAYETYTHFTSPIRRYPDLLVHRTIIDLLSPTRGKQRDGLTLDACEAIGLQCSETERRSDDATRDAILALKCHYMQDKVGDHFHGVISGVANFGIFVELKNIYVEGMIHVTGLGNEYFEYDPIHHRMMGERSRTVYRLGDRLEVKVVRVDIEAKRIELELLYPPMHRSSRPREAPKKRRRRRRRDDD